jgi:hypothetical protein
MNLKQGLHLHLLYSEIHSFAFVESEEYLLSKISGLSFNNDKFV